MGCRQNPLWEGPDVSPAAHAAASRLSRTAFQAVAASAVVAPSAAVAASAVEKGGRARASIVPSAVDRGQLVTGRKGDDRVATPQRSCARPHHQSAIQGERLAKERLRCHGLDASVESWARRQRCSLRCGGLGVRTQPLLLPRADRPAAALVPSTSHGAARIMIELRNKHTLTGQLCCFQIVLCAQLGGDFLSQSLTSKGLCRRIHFRRMPSVNDGPSDMPDSGFAATSLLAGSPTSRIDLVFCSFSRLALGLDLLRSFAFCLCGSLHLRDPGSFSLCLLGRFALDLAGGFTLGLLRR